MKHLVIYSHPNPRSFNHAIKETFQKVLEEKGDEVRVRDLYVMGFDPVLSANDFEALEKSEVLKDVKAEQDHVRWADVITFIFPVWWNSLPAIARGYIDRVFSVGFAYTEKMEGLLPDKKVLVICTMNAPKEVSQNSGAFKAMDFTIGQSLADFCGMTLLKQKYFNSVVLINDKERKDMLVEVEKMAGEIS